MPQHLTRVATIRPSEIIGDVYMRYEDAPEGYSEIYNYQGIVATWEWSIGRAVAALLPGDLFVRPVTSDDPEGETVWEVYSASPAADSQQPIDGTRSNAEREADRRMADVLWLQTDQRAVAERINLDKLTRDAIQQARQADHA